MDDSQGSLKFENTHGQLIVEGSKVKVVAQGEDSVGKVSAMHSPMLKILFHSLTPLAFTDWLCACKAPNWRWFHLSDEAKI